MCYEETEQARRWAGGEAVMYIERSGLRFHDDSGVVCANCGEVEIPGDPWPQIEPGTNSALCPVCGDHILVDLIGHAIKCIRSHAERCE